MSMEAGRKQALVKKYARKKGDTGSPEVQVAIKTARINYDCASLVLEYDPAHEPLLRAANKVCAMAAQYLARHAPNGCTLVGARGSKFRTGCACCGSGAGLD